MRIRNNIKFVEVQEWDRLVEKTYGKPYCFQQQDGCKSRGIFKIIIPSEEIYDNGMYDEIPFIINGGIMGVKFHTWLNTTVEEINIKIPEVYKNQNNLFWYRNFYPDIYTLANDLYKKGLIEEGEYVINIDW